MNPKKINELINKIDIEKLKSPFERLHIGEFISSHKIIYIVVLVFLLVISGYHMYFAKRLIPGVFVGGVKVGGETYSQAVSKLKEYEILTNKIITVSYAGKTYDLKPEDIELIYDWEATVNRAFEVGRTGNVFIDTKDKIAGLFKKLYIPTYYDFEEKSLQNFIATVQGDLDSPAEDAKYVIKSTKELELVSEKYGQVIDDKRLYTDLIKSFDTFTFGTKTLEVKSSEPKVNSIQLQKDKADAEKSVFTPLSVVYEKKEWKLTNEQKLEFLMYDLEEQKLGFNKVAYRVFLDSIASEVNKLPRGKVTALEGNKVLGFELKQDGIEINVDQSAEAFKKALLERTGKAEIKVDKISGPVDPKEYGIFALLGEGHSKFSGSAAGRIHNLTLAAERTDGVIVPPGGVYSFNESVGEISGANGYNSAYVIVGNRTVLGDGGGVCQTSTTMFRAALNAGLPIVTRHPHAYRVRYYELESPIGIDASVYQPTLDFQFKNDTPNYILIQASWNLDEDSLAFKIYGTPDGRKIEISEPVISSESAPLEARYQDDPTLEKGITKQVDWAAWGANVSFTRKVTRGSEILYDDIFKTNYQPWRAIYLVGTKEN